jgi:hypothetical protein
MSQKNTLDEQVYKSYQLTFQSYYQFRIGHPAAFRQLARKTTVERYALSDAEVKRIITEQDALRGIIHAK